MLLPWLIALMAASIFFDAFVRPSELSPVEGADLFVIGQRRRPRALGSGDVGAAEAHNVIDGVAAHEPRADLTRVVTK